MNVASPPEGILDPQQPYWPADKVNERTWLRLKGKLTGRRVEGLSENFTSYVKLGDADADRLIENIKKYGKYPQVNQNDKYGGAYNNEAYQEWLVEEFLEKPFQQQTNQKIEDAAIESRLKEIQEQREEKKKKAQSFVSGSTSFRPGKTISLKTTKIAGIVPKRTIPQDIASKITPPDNTSESETESGQTITSKSESFSLGRLTLDLVQIGDNLDKIKEVIEEDYRQTKETNKKEIEEYRKRVSNRGRKLPRKDLGDNKKDLKDIIKPFVGSFFSGMGGAIRSLAAFNLLDALVRGDWGQAFKSLMGIGITFLPQIGAMVAGAVLKSLLKGFGKSMVGGRPPVGPTRMAGGGGGPGVGVGKFGKMLALGTGALALGSAFAASQGEESPEDESQTRLEEVTAEQKALTADGVGAITQQDLRKFQTLNEKFERSVDLLLSSKLSLKSGANGSNETSSSGAPDLNVSNVDPIGPVAENQNEAYRMVREAAVKAGSPDPDMTASIAMLESGWMNPNLTQSRYNQSGRTNPFGQTGQGTRGSVNGFAVYNSLEEGVEAHVRLWSKDYGSTPEESVRKMRDAGYNQEGGGGPWMRKVLGIYKGMKGVSTTPAAQPRPARNPEVSATPSSSGRSVAVVPFPVTGNDIPGSVNPGGSSEIASLDPGRTDYYSNKLVLGVIG